MKWYKSYLMLLPFHHHYRPFILWMYHPYRSECCVTNSTQARCFAMAFIKLSKYNVATQITAIGYLNFHGTYITTWSRQRYFLYYVSFRAFRLRFETEMKRMNYEPTWSHVNTLPTTLKNFFLSIYLNLDADYETHCQQ